MKLASLLSQYLYANKRLDLPGIGSFTLAPSASPAIETDKQQKGFPAESISFDSNPSIKESPELVAFISSQTGKMKALASADLNSHLDLVQEFLNIGKPFLLEGIGNLVKIRSGKYEFTSGVIQPEKLKDISIKEVTATSATEESFSSTDPANKAKAISWKKPVMVLLILVGTGLAVLGGYTIYKKNADRNDTGTVTKKEPETVLVADTVSLPKKDIPVDQPPVASIPAGNYKFVLEMAGKKRAFDRFHRLKTFQWNVQMETKDSLQYKLFLVLPTAPADTSRLMDSLTALNGRKVYIEKLN